MKTKLLFTKQNSNAFYILLVFCLCFNYGTSQQVIGEFTEIDGGLEAQSVGTMSNAGSSQADAAQTTWTVSSSSRAAIREIESDAAKARSGNISVTMKLLASAGSNIRLQSISTTSPAFAVSTEYTIQFWYKSSVNPGDDLDPGIYLNNTSSGSAGNKTDATTWAAGTYTKAYATRTTGTIFNASNWAVARMSGSNETEVTFDDFVVYAGSYDDTAPSDATVPTYDIAGNVSWTAPAGGVDGGGYVVFKYTTMPNADNDPNQNGIYRVGSTTTNGTGGLTGTVAYIGTATTFNDTYVAGNFYKVYAVDKAFNYSNEIVVSDALLGVEDDLFASNFRIYPNPVKDIINIESNNIEVSSVKMYNLLGKEVFSQKGLQGKSIDVSSLSSGMYILKVDAEGKSLNRKIVVQ